MKTLKYLKISLGCIIGIILIDIVLVLFALCSLLGMFIHIIKRTFYLIFHPVKFFTEKEEPKKENTFLESLKKGFMDGITSHNGETLQ